jgi:hypothetical protein
MSADATQATISPEAIARRRAAHEHELLMQRRWRRAVGLTGLALLLFYVSLLVVVVVRSPFYLLVNLLAVLTALSSILVFRVYELPTILAELPRLSDRERRINLAAIEPIRSELLGQVLPSLGLVRTREQAAAMDDDELVRRLAELQRPDWRKIARRCFIAWIIIVPLALAGIVIYRPGPMYDGKSLLERMRE